MTSAQATERTTRSYTFAESFLNLPNELRHEIFAFAHDSCDPRLYHGMKMTLSSGKVHEFVLVSSEGSHKVGSKEILNSLLQFHEEMDPAIRSDYQAWKTDIAERNWSRLHGVLRNVAVLAVVTQLHLKNTPRSSDPLLFYVERQSRSCLSKEGQIKDIFEITAHSDDTKSHTHTTNESHKWQCLDTLKGLTVRNPAFERIEYPDPLLTIKHLFLNLGNGTSIADDKRLLSAWARKHFGEKPPTRGRTFTDWGHWLRPAPLTADFLSDQLKDATIKPVPLEDLVAPMMVIRAVPRLNE